MKLFVPGLILLAFIVLTGVSHAYNQSEVCYSQCAAYRLAWQDDPAFAFFQEYCVMDKKEVGKEMFNAWISYLATDVDFQSVMMAFVCADTINKYIAPTLRGCRATCAEDNLSYAPNLYVGDRNVYYDEADKLLRIRVANSGRAYIDKITVDVYAGYATTRNDSPSMILIKHQALDGLRPFYVRYSPEGYVNDRSFTVNWRPKKDMYNVIKIVVSTDQKYQEMSTRDNTYIFTIDDLPQPAYLRFAGKSYEREPPATNKFIIRSTIMNGGEVSGEVTLNYYLGSDYNNTPMDFVYVNLAGGQNTTLEKEIIFSNPRPDYVTAQLVQDGAMIDEQTFYLQPQFLFIRGTISDEEGNPINDSIVDIGVGNSDFPLTSGAGQATRTDANGNYKMPLALVDEGTVTVTVRKVGYFGNSSSVSFAYNDSDTTNWAGSQFVYLDMTMTQYPAEIYVQYPANGWYNALTDKGQFRGAYGHGTAPPVRGNDGTMVITSSNCTAFVSNFTIQWNGGNISTPNVKCLQPDTGDEYNVLSAKQIVWEKNYTGEGARLAAFSKNGKYAYVLTVNNGNSFCNLYEYDLATGNQIYRIPFNALCGGQQKSRLFPAYDGSVLYAAITAPRYAKQGDNNSAGYLISSNGSIVEQWLWVSHTETLAYSSATDMADIVEGSGFYAAGYGDIDNCMLTAGDDCVGGGYAYIEQLGVARNRALGRCNNTLCVFTLGSPDYVLLGGNYANFLGAGNYVNNDVFVGNYDGGSYYRDGTKLWSVDQGIIQVSMSPGGKYIVVGYHAPDGLDIFKADGTKVTPPKVTQSEAAGLEATETGIYYADDKGSKITVYRLSDIGQSSSTTTTSEGDKSTRYTGQFWQPLVDAYNAIVSFFTGLFGG